MAKAAYAGPRAFRLRNFFYNSFLQNAGLQKARGPRIVGCISLLLRRREIQPTMPEKFVHIHASAHKTATSQRLCYSPSHTVFCLHVNI